MASRISFGIDAGNGAADDVAGVIAARAAGGDADGLEFGEDIEEILDPSQCIWIVWRVVMSQKAVSNPVGELRRTFAPDARELAAGNLGPNHENPSPSVSAGKHRTSFIRSKSVS